MNNFIDLVIAGPDFSGTTTQIKDIISYFKSVNVPVRDLRGTEIDALFHTEMFSELNKDYSSLTEFFLSNSILRNNTDMYDYFLKTYLLLSGVNSTADLTVASMVHNDCTEYVDPNSADVWIMEEPPRRGAGQVCRVIEQNRSKFDSQLDGYSAALAHQAYRTEEFLRFRKPLREAGKVIVRSRSEESACYQIYDEKSLHSGISIDEYLELPGHKVAFANPPSHIFVVCGPIDWNKDEYLKLKTERTGKRVLDDHEKNYSYQLLVNQRYATDWIENLYKKGCAMYDSKEPMIVKFDIYNDMIKTEKLMNEALKLIALGNVLEKHS